MPAIFEDGNALNVHFLRKAGMVVEEPPWAVRHPAERGLKSAAGALGLSVSMRLMQEDDDASSDSDDDADEDDSAAGRRTGIASRDGEVLTLVLHAHTHTHTPFFPYSLPTRSEPSEQGWW